MSRILLSALAFCAAVIVAPPADAQPGCFTDTVRRGIFGLQSLTRTMCDGPVLPDGSWTRHRVIGIPAHYQNAHSSCSHSTYSSNCTYYEAGWVAEDVFEEDVYPVRPETVLPDEPGHIL
ncbi:CDGP domain-containing protein [Mycobacterium kyogaense]|uniref:CDGP domain-containing protein n=1 Tax=Mycobacterium kyogaense TaxID=2212479 RepID=UPI000DABCA77|nr:hypothetical protein [Mycobacterium kyogaense]